MQKIIWSMGQMNEEQMAEALNVPVEKKIRKVCKYCGSEDVRADAWAEWDFDKQEWVLAETYDNEYCNSCEGDTKVIDVEVEDE